VRRDCVGPVRGAIETRFFCLPAEYLQDKITQETTQAEFTKLPFRFAEISRVLLDGYAFLYCFRRDATRPQSRASDDLQNPDKLRTLLQDLREARQAKARAGLESLEHSTLGARHPLLLCLLSLTSRFAHVALEPLRDGDQRNPPVLHSSNGRPRPAASRRLSKTRSKSNIDQVLMIQLYNTCTTVQSVQPQQDLDTREMFK
jgi:hypothetical protein